MLALLSIIRRNGKRRTMERYTVRQLSECFAGKQMSPVEVAKDVIRRMHDFEGLNAINCFDEEALLRNAAESEERYSRGAQLSPLDGIPIGIKDIINTKNLVTTYGCAAYADNRPEKDAWIVRTLKSLGVSTDIKCNTSQFAMGPTGEWSLHGAVQNPNHPGYVTGGSSSGCGAAVAAGILPAAIGTESGGSIRIPASLCGLVGMKPTYGMISCEGVMPFSEAVDTIGPLTSTVYDNALLLQNMIRYNPGDWRNARVAPDAYLDITAPVKGRKVAVPTGLFEGADPSVSGGCRAAVKELEKLGVRVVEKELPDLTDYAAAQNTVMLGAAYAAHERDLADNREYLYEEIIRRLENGRISAADYVRAERKKNELRKLLLDWMGDCSCIAYPTTPVPACRIGESYRPFELNGRLTTPYETIGSTTFIATATGFPCVSVPAGKTAEGLPYGLAFLGRPYEEALLYQFAEKVERVCG